MDWFTGGVNAAGSGFISFTHGLGALFPARGTPVVPATDDAAQLETASSTLSSSSQERKRRHTAEQVADDLDDEGAATDTDDVSTTISQSSSPLGSSPTSLGAASVVLQENALLRSEITSLRLTATSRESFTTSLLEENERLKRESISARSEAASLSTAYDDVLAENFRHKDTIAKLLNAVQSRNDSITSLTNEGGSHIFDATLRRATTAFSDTVGALPPQEVMPDFGRLAQYRHVDFIKSLDGPLADTVAAIALQLAPAGPPLGATTEAAECWAEESAQLQARTVAFILSTFVTLFDPARRWDYALGLQVELTSLSHSRKLMDLVHHAVPGTASGRMFATYLERLGKKLEKAEVKILCMYDIAVVLDQISLAYIKSCSINSSLNDMRAAIVTASTFLYLVQQGSPRLQAVNSFEYNKKFWLPKSNLAPDFFLLEGLIRHRGDNVSANSLTAVSDEVEGYFFGVFIEMLKERTSDGRYTVWPAGQKTDLLSTRKTLNGVSGPTLSQNKEQTVYTCPNPLCRTEYPTKKNVCNGEGGCGQTFKESREREASLGRGDDPDAYTITRERLRTQGGRCTDRLGPECVVSIPGRATLKVKMESCKQSVGAMDIDSNLSHQTSPQDEILAIKKTGPIININPNTESRTKKVLRKLCEIAKVRGFVVPIEVQREGILLCMDLGTGDWDMFEQDNEFAVICNIMPHFHAWWAMMKCLGGIGANLGDSILLQEQSFSKEGGVPMIQAAKVIRKSARAQTVNRAGFIRAQIALWLSEHPDATEADAKTCYESIRDTRLGGVAGGEDFCLRDLNLYYHEAHAQIACVFKGFRLGDSNMGLAGYAAFSPLMYARGKSKYARHITNLFANNCRMSNELYCQIKSVESFEKVSLDEMQENEQMDLLAHLGSSETMRNWQVANYFHAHDHRHLRMLNINNGTDVKNGRHRCYSAIADHDDYNDIKRVESLLVHSKVLVKRDRPPGTLEGKPLLKSLHEIYEIGISLRVIDAENLRQGKARSVPHASTMTDFEEKKRVEALKKLKEMNQKRAAANVAKKALASSKKPVKLGVAPPDAIEVELDDADNQDGETAEEQAERVRIMADAFMDD